MFALGETESWKSLTLDKGASILSVPYTQRYVFISYQTVSRKHLYRYRSCFFLYKLLGFVIFSVSPVWGLVSQSIQPTRFTMRCLSHLSCMEWLSLNFCDNLF